MVCQACHRTTTAFLLCEGCRRRMRAASDRVLPAGIKLVAAFEHSGPARRLVHQLKYRGLTPYSHLVAAMLAPRLPRLPVVPVPRAASRHLRYGVDPARLLAGALADTLGTEVLSALKRPMHDRRRAGRNRRFEVRPFTLGRVVPGPVVVVDDVVTTGATIVSAIHAVGSGRVAAAAAANVVPQVFDSGAR